MIKAIFFDIDGTLVSFKTHRVPASAVQALEEARRRGVKIFIATGRQLHFIDNLGSLTFDGYITLNGGYCLAGKDEVIYRRSIPSEDIEALIRYQQTVEPFPCAFVLEDHIYLNYKDEAVERMFELIRLADFPLRPLEEISGKTVYQLIAFFSEEQEKQIMPALPHCEATRWNALFADVVPAGSNKAVGIDKLIAHYGISLEETMAFGDGGNDIAMLRHAGIGVAMGNAKDPVKQAADYVTAPVDEDGIRLALEHFGII